MLGWPFLTLSRSCARCFHLPATSAGSARHAPVELTESLEQFLVGLEVNAITAIVRMRDREDHSAQRGDPFRLHRPHWQRAYQRNWSRSQSPSWRSLADPAESMERGSRAGRARRRDAQGSARARQNRDSCGTGGRRGIARERQIRSRARNRSTHCQSIGYCASGRFQAERKPYRSSRSAIFSIRLNPLVLSTSCVSAMQHFALSGQKPTCHPSCTPGSGHRRCSH